jgi:hypothetical protein
VRELLHLHHAGLVLLKILWRRAGLVLDFDIFECRGAAQQNLALRQFCGRQRARLIEAGVDPALQDGALAYPTAAVAAFVGKIDVLPQTGVEQRFAKACTDRLVIRVEGDRGSCQRRRPAVSVVARESGRGRR